MFGNGTVYQPKPVQGPDGKQLPRFLVPHVETFAGIVGGLNTYRWRFDQALKHSRENSLAMRRDTFIAACLQERYLAAAQLNWHIVPENPNDPEQVAVANDMELAFRNLPDLDGLMMACLEAIWYGRAGAHLLWGYQGERLEILDHYPVNGDKWVFTYEGVPGVLIHQQADLPADAMISFTERNRAVILDTAFYREQFILAYGPKVDADFFEPEHAGQRFGTGARNWIYWYWWLLQEVMGWIIDYVEKVGLGITVFYYEQGNPEAEEKAKEAAREQSRNTVLVLPRPIGQERAGSAVERIEVPVEGAHFLLQIVETYFKDAIRKFINGQTLSSAAESTGLGSGVADLHASTKDKLSLADSKRQGEALTRDLVRPYQKWNYPSRVQGQRYRWQFTINRSDMDRALASARAIFDMGGQLNQDELLSIANLTKPKEGDRILQRLDPTVNKDVFDMQMGQAQQQQDAAGAQQNGRAPYLGPRGGRGEKNLATGKVRYGDHLANSQTLGDLAAAVQGDYRQGGGPEQYAKGGKEQFKDIYNNLKFYNEGFDRQARELLGKLEDPKERESLQSLIGQKGSSSWVGQMLGKLLHEGFSPDEAETKISEQAMKWAHPELTTGKNAGYSPLFHGFQSQEGGSFKNWWNSILNNVGNWHLAGPRGGYKKERTGQQSGEEGAPPSALDTAASRELDPAVQAQKNLDEPAAAESDQDRRQRDLVETRRSLMEPGEAQDRFHQDRIKSYLEDHPHHGMTLINDNLYRGPANRLPIPRYPTGELLRHIRELKARGEIEYSNPDLDPLSDSASKSHMDDRSIIHRAALRHLQTRPLVTPAAIRQVSHIRQGRKHLTPEKIYEHLQGLVEEGKLPAHRVGLKTPRSQKELPGAIEDIARGQGEPPQNYQKDPQVQLNAMGGTEPQGEDRLRAKKAVLITLPLAIKGTNCFNCLYLHRDGNKPLGHCVHPQVRLPVTARQCCNYWTAPSTIYYARRTQLKANVDIASGRHTYASDIPAEPHSDERRGHLDHLLGKVDQGLQGHQGLTEEHKGIYRRSLGGLLRGMPTGALKRLRDADVRMEFHPDVEGVHDSYAKISPALAERVAANRQRGAHIPGFLDSTGRLVIDGARRSSFPTHEIHAHELSHALDHWHKGAGARLSDTPDWQKVWKDEIQGGTLSEYGGTNPYEGFAEFGRLLYSRQVDPSDLWQSFPAAASFFEKRGLLPSRLQKPMELEL